MKQQYLSDAAGESVNLYNSRITSRYLLKLTCALWYDPETPFIRIYPRGIHKSGIKMFTAVLFVIAKNWRQVKCPPTVTSTNKF